MFRFALKLAVLSLSVLMVSSCTGKQEVKIPPTLVKTGKVKSEQINYSMDFVGLAVANESVDIIARVQGVLVKKGCGDGDYVKKGQLLFEIEKNQYNADLKAAEAALQQTEAVLKNAKIEIDRNTRLVRKDAVAKTDFDKATMNYEAAHADMLEAEARLETAKINLDYTDIYAPFDGKTSVSKYDIGNLVGPGSKPLTTVTMIDPIIVEFSVSEPVFMTTLQDRIAGDDKKERNVDKSIYSNHVIPYIILSDGTEYKYPGEIFFIDNKVNRQGAITFRAYFPNHENVIIPGAYVKVMITSKENSLLVPQKAVQENTNGEFVFVIGKNNVAEQRYIKTCGEYEQSRIVKSGVREGELIVVEGLQKIRAGTLVNPVTEPVRKE